MGFLGEDGAVVGYCWGRERGGGENVVGGYSGLVAIVVGGADVEAAVEEGLAV